MVSIGFQQGEVDLCLIYRKNELGMFILILYVDNCLLVRDEPAIESGINDIKKIFNLSITRDVMEYLSCKINLEKEREMKIHHPQNLEEKS